MPEARSGWDAAVGHPYDDRVSIGVGYTANTVAVDWVGRLVGTALKMRCPLQITSISGAGDLQCVGISHVRSSKVVPHSLPDKIHILPGYAA